MATAGIPLLIKWNHRQGIFRCRYTADSAIAAPTVIYLPAERFGPQTTITAPLRCEFRREEQRLLIFNDGFGGEVEVVVRCNH